MIYPKKNKFILWFLNTYVRLLLKNKFNRITFNSVRINTGQPVLLIANHFSIWDGLILYWLNHELFKKNFHVMILEETAIREPFLKYGGAFSVKKRSRQVLESLRFAASLLNNPQNLVLLFPQGKIYSNFVDIVHFEKGLAKILKQATGNFQTVFAVTFVENFKYKKPVVTIYLEKQEESYDAEKLYGAYQQFYSASKTKQIQITY